MRHGRLLSCLVLAALVGISVLPGCGDDNGTKPEEFTVADFAGTWDVTQYRVTHKTIPQMTVDFIEQGATLYFIATATGAFTGEMEAFDTGSQQMITLPFAGAFILVDQQTVTVTFTPEIEPYLTNFTGSFTFEDDTIAMTDDDATFDFDDDGTDEPVTAEVTLVRR